MKPRVQSVARWLRVYSRAGMDEIRIPAADEVQALLGQRLGDAVVRARLNAERGEGRPVAGRSSAFSYFEEWFLGPALLRGALRLCGLYARGRANALRISSVQNELRSPRLPQPLHGLRVLQLSDIHIDVSAEFERALHRSVDLAGAYDLCVITGDLRFSTHGDARPALAAMRRLRPALRARTLLVLGNHDSLRWVPVLESFGYEVLVNESAFVQRQGSRLWVMGVDDAGYFGACDLQAAGKLVPNDACRLVLSHSPEIVRDAQMDDCDFVLCGHSHGGQINLPGGWPVVTNSRCARRFCKGPWRKGRTSGYTSAGAGTSMLDVRFNCPAEITLHTLVHAG